MHQMLHTYIDIDIPIWPICHRYPDTSLYDCVPLLCYPPSFLSFLVESMAGCNLFISDPSIDIKKL
ncbi:hypothetical protein BGW80DRAFT_1273091 [Lactifluus volemus]|nr:hypothetical protein BGW80DRAFT_1273091 [Lactifluus volemus]